MVRIHTNTMIAIILDNSSYHLKKTKGQRIKETVYLKIHFDCSSMATSEYSERLTVHLKRT